MHRSTSISSLRTHCAAVLAAASLFTATGCAVDSSDEATNEWEGELKVRIEGKLGTSYHLETAPATWLKLGINEGEDARAVLEAMRSGRRITVHGTLVGDTIAVSDVVPVGLVERSDALTTTLGQRKVLVLVGKFAQGTPLNVAAVRTGVFEATRSVNARFVEYSFGKFSISGDVLEVNLSGGSTRCDDTSWMTQAVNAAKAKGKDAASYQHVMLVTPSTVCEYGGSAYVEGRESWINSFTAGTEATVVHELGHNFGLQHANLYTCKSGNTQTRDTGTCTSLEYGDPADPMGDAYEPHYSAFHKERLGWLDLSKNLKVVNAPGTFTIAPSESASTGIQSLRIPTGAGDFYALEYRTLTKLDQRLNSGLVNGVLVRLVSAPAASRVTNLIDMTPSTATAEDAALRAGQSFVPAKGSYKMQVKSVSATGAVVEVALKSPGAADQCPSDPNKTETGACGCGKREPFDAANYSDAKGYACSDWAGYDCTRAAEDHGYTAAQETAILANCSQSCSVCPN